MSRALPFLISLIAAVLWLATTTAAIGQPVSTPLGRSVAPGSQDAGPGPKSTPRITAELVPMSRWATPGSTAIVAVRQNIEPGWHTYWRNPGDSGGATTLAWTAPRGVEAGGIVWPVPERQRLQSLMNFGYSGEVFLPVPIEIPADARPGTTIPLRTEALFLVCNPEMCVPDELVLTLDLPIGDGAPPLDPRHGADIQTALTSAPGPGDFEARLTPDGPNGAVVLSVVGSELAEATQAWFFPFQGGQVDHPSSQPGERGERGLSLNLTPGGGWRIAPPSGPIQGLLWTDVGAWEITAQPGPPLPGASGSGALTDPDAAAAGSTLALPMLIAFALIGGLILNLMPCVFPVLAMKAASLAKGAHEPAAARRDGLAFLLGVLVTFAILAGVLLALRAAGQSVGWGFQLQSPPVTAALALLMLAVGLNLSGLYHVGGGAQALAGEAESKASTLPRGAQSFLTGVLAVVVAAPCTAPFMAVALGAAVTLPALPALAIFLALGLGLALPYLIVSLTPAIMRRLPRPGPWMVTLQRWLAIPLYLTALWLAWVFARQTDTTGALLLAGAAAALALGLFALGRAGGRPVMVGGLALGLALSGGLAWAAATRPAAPGGQAGYEEGVLPAVAWSPEAVSQAQADGRPVLVNFTADWCLTCKVNERAALQRRATAEAFEEANAVYMVGDWTLRDAPIARELERHGRSGVPLYLVYGPGDDEPRILPQILTPGAVTAALADATADPGARS
ncbi:protein-disulfide reductase DsbD family protein [Brevundimonas sp.]|uniref:protein-disulfide reductase DsbD family protein n=1 Tax=Brevundimonas sp. TaxID=1871086 RepID=UPI0035AF3647